MPPVQRGRIWAEWIFPILLLLEFLIPAQTRVEDAAYEETEDVSIAGILLHGSGGVGPWADGQVIARAMSSRGVSLRTARKKVWRASVRVAGVSHGSKVKMHEVTQKCSKMVHPDRRCVLDPDTELADGTISLQSWSQELDSLVVVGFGPEFAKENSDIRQNLTAACRRIKVKGGTCSVLPAEGVSQLGWELDGKEWELWARGPSEERKLNTLVQAGNAGDDGGGREDEQEKRHQIVRVIPIPWTVTATVARDAWFSSPESPLAIVVSTSVEGDGEECDRRVMSQACKAAQEAGNNTRLIAAVHNPRGDWHSMIELCEGVQVKTVPFASLSILRDLYRNADFAIFPDACQRSPSATAMVALHSGLPIVCRDHAAFTDIVTPLHDAIVVPNGTSLGVSISKLLFGNGGRTLRRLTVPQPGLLLARQHACLMLIRGRMAGEGSIFKVLSLWPGPNVMHRRTERFRSDSLRRHGYSVTDATYSQAWGSILASSSYEFILAAKPPVDFVKRARAVASGTPFYVWTWDLIDYEGDASRRAWLEEVAGISDAVFLNEAGRERMWAKTTNGTVHYVNDGTVFIGSAGAGRRPLDGKEWIPSHGGPDVVFVGGGDEQRANIIKGLQSKGVSGVEVYGPRDQWERQGVEVAGEVWGHEAAQLEMTAKVSLSISRPGEAMYHSDRLLRQTASGSCVVSNDFPGLDHLFPPGCVESVGNGSWVEAVKRLISDDAGRDRMRVRAAEVTWRRHTWEDSVRKFLFLASGGFATDLAGEYSAEHYHAEIAHELLLLGDASEALVHFTIALRFEHDASVRITNLRAAVKAAVYSGQFRYAEQLIDELATVESTGGQCLAGRDVELLGPLLVAGGSMRGFERGIVNLTVLHGCSQS